MGLADRSIRLKLSFCRWLSLLLSSLRVIVVVAVVATAAVVVAVLITLVVNTAVCMGWSSTSCLKQCSTLSLHVVPLA